MFLMNEKGSGGMEQVILPAYRVGAGVLESSGELVMKHGTNALIVGGRKGLAAALPRLRAGIEKAGVRCAGVEYYGGECTYDHMARLADIGRACGADLVIGVGGGKAIDTAKGCAYRLGVPVITVPTIAATCAAVTKLSVVYDENRVFQELMFFDAPPAFALIDMQVLQEAPPCYLLAGIGDALAKHVECAFTSRGRALPPMGVMGVTVSAAIYESLIRYGAKSFEEMKNVSGTEALEHVALTSIVTTGLVSLLIEEKYNGGVAHALFYGLTSLPGFEDRVLHGHAVGYGVLVQLALDGQSERFRELRAFYEVIGMPRRLEDMGYPLTDELLGRIAPLAAAAFKRDRESPYPVTEEMIRQAMLETERT